MTLTQFRNGINEALRDLPLELFDLKRKKVVAVVTAVGETTPLVKTPLIQKDAVVAVNEKKIKVAKKVIEQTTELCPKCGGYMGIVGYCMKCGR